jgi:hypothetical protein
VLSALSRRRVPALLAALAVMLLGACGDGEQHRSEVASRGAEVMPFDLEATTHRFEPTSDGGVQQVVTDVPDDASQVGLVRGHLRKEAARFARGDFADPAAIHGHEMPGLAELVDGHARIAIDYQEIAAGAQLTYRTDDASLVRALHEWFKAQLADHGRHAEAGTR